MTNIYNKQRKYSLRKSKAYGLTLAVIGILYFGHSNHVLAAETVTNSDNVTVSSDSNVSPTENAVLNTNNSASDNTISDKSSAVDKTTTNE